MRSLSPAVVCVLIAAVLADAYAQDKVLTVDVDIVNVLFTVHDRRNGLVGGLQKDDFTVIEDGKEQTIKYFTRETDLPLTIGLLIDVSKSQENMIEPEKQAASRFFSEVLRSKDMAFLISFGPDAELLQDYTNSAKLLRKGLDDLKVSTSFTGMMGPGPVPTANRPRGTVMFDSVYLAAAEKLRREVGRKAIVLITDGMDQGSRYKLHDAVEAAQKADTIIYSIYYADRRNYGGSDSDLKKMSDETGGRVFHVDGKNNLHEIFARIQEEMRSQYSIGYTPTNQNRDGGYRKLEIKTVAKELKVQARKGYYAAKSEIR
ncbi:MAG TPA: VWA domain-containing protein [Bryobacteraceae bacterium]|nr:VWA domain-containing protein [Bryobacteraceae bacterium]